ncbi:hypothetical protein NW752_002457 [Fusarium irregulare]|uniref:Uncharacterized protein n=1 Tax=Fusarium irregulare TaxID=2494466 RepID=A0A9W8U643_9HYPO|nr:hypothetical protein NW766_011174 [Fusarium irregulare]KAJ4025001.1 hypothetical protein NW752_002457 [Fusarium irregulare]
MSTPPYSTPSSPTKRKLNATGLETAIPLEVVSNTEKESRLELLGDNIKEQAAKLKDRAQRAVKDPKIDHDDLRDSWRTLLMLIVSRTNEAAEIEAHKATAAQLKTTVEQLDQSREEHQAWFFLALIGDWCSGIHDRFKKDEGHVGHLWRGQLKKVLKKKGLSAVDADHEARSYTDFVAASGFQATKTLGLLQPELQSIEDWNANGKTGEAPATPDRNDTFHNARPELLDFLDDAGNVDWDGVWAACQERKSTARLYFEQGRLTASQLHQIRKVVDLWFRVHVSGWNEDGSPILSGPIINMVAKMVNERAKASSKPPVKIPDSPWYEGKWDNLQEEVLRSVSF